MIKDMSEVWDLWQDERHSPFMNMAIDEALMLTAKERGRPILRLYEWNEDSISIGYVQKMSRVSHEGMTVVRRPTGGGIVYHKYHFTYTVVLPNDHWIVADTQPVESYNYLNRAVQESLNLLKMSSELASDEIPKSVDRAGMVCFVTPTKYDLISDSRKIAGSAQRRAKEGMLHQGSIEMEGVAELSAGKLRKILPEGFSKVLNCDFEPFQPLDPVLSLASDLSISKYSTIEWNNKR